MGKNQFLKQIEFVFNPYLRRYTHNDLYFKNGSASISFGHDDTRLLVLFHDAKKYSGFILYFERTTSLKNFKKRIKDFLYKTTARRKLLRRNSPNVFINLENVIRGRASLHYEEARQEILNEIKRMSLDEAMDSKIYIYGSSYSAYEIYHEVKQETEFGKEYVQSYTEALELICLQ